jgi:hypothetical protein
VAALILTISQAVIPFAGVFPMEKVMKPVLVEAITRALGMTAFAGEVKKDKVQVPVELNDSELDKVAAAAGPPSPVGGGARGTGFAASDGRNGHGSWIRHSGKSRASER